MTTMITIHHLPIELLSFIMRNLGIVDLTRCRAVCRSWRFFCDKQYVNELIIKSGKEPQDTWYHSDKPIERDNVITMDVFESKHLVFRRQLTACWLLRNLKRMKISSNKNASFHFFAQLYKFPHLEQLDCEFPVADYSLIAISHPNLRVLYLYLNDTLDSKLDIDAKQLEVCHAGGCFHDVTFVHPTSVRKLDACSNDSLVNSALQSFVNLESLSVCDNCHVDPIALVQLSKLKELRIQFGYEDDEMIQDYDHYSWIKESVIPMIRMKKSLQINQLQLYYDDVELTDEKQFKRLLTDLYNYCIDSDDSMEDSDDDQRMDQDPPADEDAVL